MDAAHATHAAPAAVAERKPSRAARLLRSSIGSKTVMAVTGLGLLLFVIAHMLGNLQIFLGQEPLNAYAQKLQDLGGLLWVLRLGLLAVFVVHVGAAVKVWRANQAARPTPYVFRNTVQATPAGRSMILSGAVVAAFVAYHLLHFTFGAAHPEYYHLRDAAGRHDVYSMVILSFRQWPITASYVAAQVLLCLHISHGASSAFQTFGLTAPRFAWLKRSFGPGVATLIGAGNIAIPLACLVGVVQPAPGA